MIESIMHKRLVVLGILITLILSGYVSVLSSYDNNVVLNDNLKSEGDVTVHYGERWDVQNPLYSCCRHHLCLKASPQTHTSFALKKDLLDYEIPQKKFLQ